MSKQRLQFDFSKDAVKKLEEIKKRTNSATRAEVIRRSLRLYDWITWQLEQGATIGIEKDGKLVCFKDI